MYNKREILKEMLTDLDMILSNHSPENLSIIKPIMLKINYDEIPESILDYAGPSVVRIFNAVLDGVNQIYQIRNNDKLKNDIINSFNLEEMLGELKSFYDDSLNVVNIHITNLDVEAELLRLFCDNYVAGLIAKNYKEE